MPHNAYLPTCQNNITTDDNNEEKQFINKKSLAVLQERIVISLFSASFGQNINVQTHTEAGL